MSLTLTTISAGAVVSATQLRAYVADMETYLNEDIAAGDRGAAWLKPEHVYRPDFFGAPNPHTTLVSGESYFRERSGAGEDRALFSYFLNTATPMWVPGLTTTIQIPQSLSGAGNVYPVRVFASFYAYEWGGADGGMTETDLAPAPAANFDLAIDGVAQGATRPLYKGSRTALLEAGAFYPRKQIALSRQFITGMSVGTHDVGVVVSPFTPAAGEWKHIIVRQGNLVVPYYIR